MPNGNEILERARAKVGPDALSQLREEYSREMDSIQQHVADNPAFEDIITWEIMLRRWQKNHIVLCAMADVLAQSDSSIVPLLAENEGWLTALRAAVTHLAFFRGMKYGQQRALSRGLRVAEEEQLLSE